VTFNGVRPITSRSIRILEIRIEVKCSSHFTASKFTMLALKQANVTIGCTFPELAAIVRIGQVVRPSMQINVKLALSHGDVVSLPRFNSSSGIHVTEP
jgi:hypothetical protein